MRFAIIGGSGFYDAGEEVLGTRTISTPYGEVQLDILKTGEEEVAFLPRHGKEHTVAPHRINYRANIAALKSLGVENILASAAVGSLNSEMKPGEIVLPTQFLDFTWGRASTFSEEGEVRHIDVSEPYCPSLRHSLLMCALSKDLVVHPEATYVCSQGPRFETPAEITMFRRLGGDLAGMTGVPEVVLAREAGICYAAVAVVTNWAAGTAEEPLSHEDFSALAEERMAIVRELFYALIGTYDKTDCPCCRPTQTE
ncbi:MAG: S-methyl-5'-thioinosine phosphorylase [Armatimonadetes bacterium]|nr:S-methyl-5'-thioinosine phosphorylase [Armatimonadota bacterium]NIO74848.1 S-methyl-5'-thioinosine phosphorylase [Armatimonadota bacterium]NIO95610.1 S-methyl-5'-thioinosine phosphorylase [Armatimonadota bacterium]